MVVCSGESSPRVNAFKGDVVFNNVNGKDLTLDSHNEACRGSCEKSLTFMMGFMEYGLPQNNIVVNLEILVGTY